MTTGYNASDSLENLVKKLVDSVTNESGHIRTSLHVDSAIIITQMHNLIQSESPPAIQCANCPNDRASLCATCTVEAAVESGDVVESSEIHEANILRNE